MKKLLALSVALLSLNLYGADKPKTEFDKHGNLVTNIRAEKPIPSRHGLEGWSKETGINLGIEDYSDLDKTFDKKAIKNQVELKLRLAGIKIREGYSGETLTVNMHPIRLGERKIGYYLDISPQRNTTFKYNGKEYISFTSRATSYGGIISNNYRQDLDKHLDQLLLDYLKANPKPKEKKSLIEP